MERDTEDGAGRKEERGKMKYRTSGATKAYTSMCKYGKGTLKPVTRGLTPRQMKFGKSLTKTVDNAVDVKNRRV